MTLDFSETAPGVHTTSMAHPKTKQRHNIAIIESCGAWQLFVDGELKVRDLPSFNAATEQAKRTILNRSSGMLGQSRMLVLGSLGVVAVVGTSLAAVPLLGSPDEASQAMSTQTPTQALAAKETIERKFTRVTAPPKPVTSQKEERKLAQKSKRARVENTVVTTVAVEPVTPTESARPAPEAKVETSPVKTTNSQPATDGIRRFSANNSLLALSARSKPNSTPSETEVAAAKTAEPIKQAEPEVISAQPPPVVITTSASNQDTGLEAEPNFARETDSNLSTPRESIETASAETEPPLPVQAPLTTPPVIRSINTVSERPKLHSMFANIDEDEADTRPATTKRAKAKKRHTNRNRSHTTKSKPRRKYAKTQRKAKHRAKRSRHVWVEDRPTKTRARRNKPRSRPHTRRRVRTARIHRPTQTRRMVCFAHTCRFR